MCNVALKCIFKNFALSHDHSIFSHRFHTHHVQTEIYGIIQSMSILAIMTNQTENHNLH